MTSPAPAPPTAAPPASPPAVATTAPEAPARKPPSVDGKPPLILGDCQRRLAILWLVTSLPAFILIISRSASPEDPLADSMAEVWGWLLGSIMPTLTLILGVMAAGAVYSEDEAPKARYASRFVFHIAVALSLFYLLIIDALAAISVYNPALLKTANLYVSPLQGLVGAALGAFFVSAKPGKPAAPA